VSARRVATAEAGSEERDRGMFKDRVRQVAHTGLGPLVRLLARGRVGPDMLTVAGLVLSLGAAVLFLAGGFQWAALLLAVGGLCDLLDGEVARERNVASTFGAFLDSTLDRLGEAIVLTGIAGFYVFHLVQLVADPSQVQAELDRGLESPRTWFFAALTAVLALVGSFLVSYTRARAEGLGLDCRIGWFERPERVVLLIIGAAFGVGNVMSIALMLLAVLSFATAGQRVLHVWKHSRVEVPGSRDPGEEP